MRDGTGTEAFHCTFVKIWFLKHSNVLPLSENARLWDSAFLSY